jgi:hypothetical protein
VRQTGGPLADELLVQSSIDDKALLHLAIAFLGNSAMHWSFDPRSIPQGQSDT